MNSLRNNNGRFRGDPGSADNAGNNGSLFRGDPGSAEDSRNGNNSSRNGNSGSQRDPGCRDQEHVHEVLGSVEIAGCDPHNHRFATVSGEAIDTGCGDHIHNVRFRTDFFEDHFHEYCGITGGAIPVGDRHVHFLQSVTTRNDGHCHRFRVGTLIDNPIGDC
jgi:hypothetical protein